MADASGEAALTHGSETADFYASRGFGGAAGFGRRPALVVIDLCHGFTDPSSPLGGDYSDVVEANRRLIEAMHARGFPVIVTTVAYDTAKAQAAAAFMAKVPSLRVLAAGSRLVEIDERLGMTTDDTLIVKQFPSAFFGTAVSSLLASAGCDTVICTGVTTSG